MTSGGIIDINLLIFQCAQVALVIIAGYLIVCGIIYNVKFRRQRVLEKYAAKKELYQAKLDLEKTKKEYKDWVYEHGDTLKLFDKTEEDDNVEEVLNETRVIANEMSKDSNATIDIPTLDELVEKEGDDFLQHDLIGKPRSYYSKYFNT